MKVKRQAGLNFSVLSDENGKLIDIMGLRHVNGSPVGGDIARSASVLVKKDGAILWSAVAENYRVRPNPEHILKRVKEVLGK